MSKRKEKIKLGKIYRIEDGSGYAHPGKAYKAYKKNKNMMLLNLLLLRRKLIH